MRYLLTLLTGLLLFSQGALASGRCYQPAEVEADQAIRIHSELMIIGLNCQHMGMRAGHNLYGMYREFTARHADLFAAYEQDLLSFYRDYGDPSPVDQLNAMRTRYANTISDEVAKMRPDVFCAKYAPRIVKAATLSQAELRSWAQMDFNGQEILYPKCHSDIALN